MNNRNNIDVQAKIFDQDFINKFGLPCYANVGDAGMDLRANLTPLIGKEGVRTDGETLIIEAGQCILIPTGIALYVKSPNYMGAIHPRSGLGHKEGLVLGNLTGVIDAHYQGQLMVSLWNRSKVERTVAHGDRIAQYVIQPIVQGLLTVVDEFESQSARGETGFGASGKQ